MKINPKIFKSYDIRGIYPEEINEDLAAKITQAYVKIVNPKGKVAVGFDVRDCSQKMSQRVIKSLTAAGVEVVDIGLSSTEEMYFAVGFYKLAGGMQLTASHNPKEYGGIKMVREEAKPITGESGIYQIRDLIIAGKEKMASAKKGKVAKKDVLADYAQFCLDFINPKVIKPLKLVFNPNFGFQGEVLKKVVEVGNLPLKLVGLNDTPDGTFPKGRPDPFRPENRPEFIKLVKSTKADLGVAWDADADRVFFCTGSGVFVEPYFMNALLIKAMLKKYPGSKIVYDPRYTWALIDSARENGGRAIISKVGHSYIKEVMRKEKAVFCGESSGHTYFKDFWYADSGMIPLLMVLEMVSKQGDLDQLLKPYLERYFISGEINYEIADYQPVFRKIEERYSDGQIDKLDGLSVEYPDWRFNLRASNTEPLVRLNIEAKSKEKLQEKVKELEGLIK
jgi:phosphomannomutase